VKVRILGSNLPGRTFGDPRPGGQRYENVHVGIQRRAEVVDLVPGDDGSATWDLEMTVVEKDGAVDVRGPYVQGGRGDRFVYLSWGTLDDAGRFEMFRRAKLMLDVLDADTLRAAARSGRGLEARLGLTGGDGGPRCAAVRPPAIEWALAQA
jgi:uncharacterized protein DUF5990